MRTTPTTILSDREVNSPKQESSRPQHVDHTEPGCGLGDGDKSIEKKARVLDEILTSAGGHLKPGSLPTSRNAAYLLNEKRYQLSTKDQGIHEKTLDVERTPSRRNSLRDLRDQIDLRSPKSAQIGVLPRNLEKRLLDIKAMQSCSSDALSGHQGREHPLLCPRTHKSLALGHHIDKLSSKLQETESNQHDATLDQDFLLDLNEDDTIEEEGSPAHLDKAIAKSLLFERRITPFLQSVEEELDGEEASMPRQDNKPQRYTAKPIDTGHNNDLTFVKPLTQNHSKPMPLTSPRQPTESLVKRNTREAMGAKLGEGNAEGSAICTDSNQKTSDSAVAK
jgi:hypothetical protein